MSRKPSIKVEDEAFVPETSHRNATDPEPFIEAASVLEAGGSIIEAFSLLTERHRTTLFHIEKCPPLPMLAKKTPHDAATILRRCAEKLETKDDE